MYRLIFLSGKMKGRRVAVQQGTIVVGRDPACHIDITDDDNVSRKHAQLEQTEDGVSITNLSTTNPTTVNGKPIHECHKLKHNDKIEIGQTALEYQRVETMPYISRRRIGEVQFLTIIAVFGILLAEVFIVFIFPSFRYHKLTELPPKPIEKKASTEPTNAEEIVTIETLTLEDELERASELLEEMPETNEERNVSTNTSVVATDIKDLREQVEDLKKQIADTTNMAAEATSETVNVEEIQTSFLSTDVVTTVIEAETTTPPIEVAPTEDPMADKAKMMLEEARMEISKGNIVQADDILAKIEELAPNFLDAYAERAKLDEQRGLLDAAGEQWGEVMNRGIGTPLFDQASAERSRLARAEVLTTPIAPVTPQANTEISTAEFPRKIRILSVEREKFQASKDYDEMRLLRINLKPRLSEGDIDPSDVKVLVTFYDRNTTTDRIAPSRAVMPKQRINVEGEWTSGNKKTVTATFILPKGFRAQEEKELGEKRTYAGYRVQISYKDEIQDEAILPKSLPRE